MATPSAARLVLLPFLQSWDGSNLVLRVVVIPKVPPLESLTSSSGPSFAVANFSFDAHFLGPENLPSAGGVIAGPFPSAAPLTAQPIFKTFEATLPINLKPSPAQRPVGSQVNKYLPLSYRSAIGYTPGGSSLVKTGSEYRCARTQNLPAQLTDKPPKIDSPTTISWGMIVAQLLKNLVLAAAVGLVREITIPITDTVLVRDGDFVYFTLSSTSDAASLLLNPVDLKVYATKFPTLKPGEKKSLYSACLFSLAEVTTVDYSQIIAEVEDYNDGFAKAVHCAQQTSLDPLEEARNDSTIPIRPLKESGIRLGWDDEQVTVWLNRQWDPTQPAYDSPLGTSGYRVDARLAGSMDWHSLTTASGDVIIGSTDLGVQPTEPSVSVYPAQLDAKLEGVYWLPVYYESWTGPAMGSRDDFQGRMHIVSPTTNMFKRVDPEVALRYGQKYDF